MVSLSPDVFTKICLKSFQLSQTGSVVGGKCCCQIIVFKDLRRNEITNIFAYYIPPITFQNCHRNMNSSCIVFFFHPTKVWHGKFHSQFGGQCGDWEGFLLPVVKFSTFVIQYGLRSFIPNLVENVEENSSFRSCHWQQPLATTFTEKFVQRIEIL